MKWRKVHLGEVAAVVGGSTPRRGRDELWNGGIPWITPTDLPMPGEGIAEVTETAEQITEEGLASCSAQLLPVGSILFSSRATIGKLGIAKVPLSTNQGFANFLPKACVDGRFLAYSLQYHTQDIAALAGTTTFKEVSKGALKHYCISLPPLSEQRRIVEILDQADALRKKRAEADVKTERILPALFIKMFGDPVTNPKGWEVTTLSDSSALVRYGLGQPPKVSPNGIPLIRATNIRRGTITDGDMMFVCRADVPESRNAFLSADEVIVVRSGAYTGDVAQVTERWTGSVAGYDLVVTPGEHFCGEYIEAYLLTPHIQKNYFGNLKARAGQPRLNASQLSATPMLCPPKSLQLRFADHIRSIRRLRERVIICSNKIDSLFNVLLHRAFSGDLTAKWREAHMKEFLVEMEEQAKYLTAQSTNDHRETVALQGSLFGGEAPR